LNALYSVILSPYACVPMLLIAAALEDELGAGMALCHDPKKIRGRSVTLWQATRASQTICFLKTGVGPRRSSANLAEALEVIKPSSILVIGYAGAIDPGLKLGSLVAVKKALAFSLDKDQPDWDHIRLDAAFELVNCEALALLAKSVNLDACAGDTLTSSYVLGDPNHKRLLYEKFHASIVDMETAALADVALSKTIPLSCVRVVSDEAQDTFLAPFSHDPSTRVSARAKKLLDTGMMRTYREWKDHACTAKESLSLFLSHYL